MITARLQDFFAFLIFLSENSDAFHLGIYVVPID
jgi:hypothetical protein